MVGAHAGDDGDVVPDGQVAVAPDGDGVDGAVVGAARRWTGEGDVGADLKDGRVGADGGAGEDTAADADGDAEFEVIVADEQGLYADRILSMLV